MSIVPFLPRKYHYTEQQMLAAGMVHNPNMWLGSGWMWCPTCKQYTYHKAMSHAGVTDCYEMCKLCRTYTGIKPI